MKKRLFILGASTLQVPAIREAKQMGLEVAVADYNPRAIGIPMADKSYLVSTNDESGVLRACRDFGADGIMTMATDMPMRVVARVGEELHLPAISYDTALKATDKGLMIKAFHERGVPAPWFSILTGDDIDSLSQLDIPSYPCIVKPVDASGSRGVHYVSDREQLAQAVRYSFSASSKKEVVVEEYLSGDEISVEAFAVNGVTSVIAVTDKITTEMPYFVELGHSQPSKFTGSRLREIVEVTSRAVEAVGIANGPAHVEMKVGSNGPRLIELGARLGGDSISSYLTPLSTGVSLVRATILQSLGEVPQITPSIHKASAIRFIDHHRSGMIKSINGIEEACAVEGVQRVELTKAVGDPVGEITNSNSRIGCVIAQCETAVEALDACRLALDRIRVDIE